MSRGGLLALGALAFVYAGMQRRWALWMTSVALAGTLIYFFAPMPRGYLDRVETIATYNEVGEGSALSRLHFWRVATVIAVANPMGIGLGNFESVYDDYDTLYGTFGTARAVHSSHFQVLAEIGFLGALGWTALFVYALYLCVKVRVAAPRVPGLSADVRHYYTTVSVALAASMIAFIVGGAFIAAATNDLTWFVFAAVAAMDRLFAREARAARPVVQEAIARVAPVRPRRAAIA
jgi:O-antigen ligase